MKENQLAAIGEKEDILVFKAAGIDTFDANTPENIAKTIKLLAKNKYKIIFITEDTALKAKDIIEKYKFQAFPIILPIPGINGSNGYSLKNINSNIEKAIGANIFD